MVSGGRCRRCGRVFLIAADRQKTVSNARENGRAVHPSALLPRVWGPDKGRSAWDVAKNPAIVAGMVDEQSRNRGEYLWLNFRQGLGD